MTQPNAKPPLTMTTTPTGVMEERGADVVVSLTIYLQFWWQFH